MIKIFEIINSTDPKFIEQELQKIEIRIDEPDQQYAVKHKYQILGFIPSIISVYVVTRVLLI
jgi:hypothetical protein